jgi:hypothetical protein
LLAHQADGVFAFEKKTRGSNFLGQALSARVSSMASENLDEGYALSCPALCCAEGTCAPPPLPLAGLPGSDGLKRRQGLAHSGPVPLSSRGDAETERWTDRFANGKTLKRQKFFQNKIK